MKALTFPERANTEHFPPNANVWDINLIFNIEKDLIDQQIQKEAGTNWRSLNSADAAIAQGGTVIGKIGSKYDPPDEICPTRIYDEARSGELERMSPTIKMITTMKIAFVVAVLTELSVMVLQGIFTGDFNPFLVVLGIFLAMGGFLQGMGIGNLLTRNWKIHTGRVEHGESLAIPSLLIGAGTALILLISAMRASGGSDTTDTVLVFLVTLLFGEAVAVCEAIKVRYSATRAKLLQEMAQAQHWQANVTHHQHMVRGEYLANYVTAVKRCADQLSQVDQTPPRPRGDGEEYAATSAPT